MNYTYCSRLSTFSSFLFILKILEAKLRFSRRENLRCVASDIEAWHPNPVVFSLSQFLKFKITRLYHIWLQDCYKVFCVFTGPINLTK